MTNTPTGSLAALAANWWTLLLRGLFALLLGLTAFFLPGLTLTVLVLVFGAYALVDVAFALVAGIRGVGGRRWVLIAEGVIGVLAGIVALVWPGITAPALLYVLAFWAVFTGGAEIAAAVTLRREIEGGWALLLGVLSVIFLTVLPCLGLLSALAGVARGRLRDGVRDRPDRAGLPRAGRAGRATRPWRQDGLTAGFGTPRAGAGGTTGRGSGRPGRARRIKSPCGFGLAAISVPAFLPPMVRRAWPR